MRSLHMSPTTDDSPMTMMAVHDFEFGSSPGPNVCLTISEGASLGNVPAALDQLKDRGGRDWKKLISDNGCNSEMDERRDQVDDTGEFLVERELILSDRVSPDAHEIASAENEGMLHRCAYAAA